MKLNKKMRQAGIIEILTENYNGSWVCKVQLPKVDLKNTRANPRRHSKSHGDKIANGFNRLCVRNPVLRYRNGKLTSIDGRHTAYVLLEKGETVVTCNVHFNINDKEAAHIFHDLTVNSKRIGTWDAHCCALQAEMTHAVEIQDAIDEYGFSTPNDQGFNQNTADLKGYDVLREAWCNKNGTLDTLLYLVRYCYTSEMGVDKEAKNTEFLRGLLDVITKDFSDWDKVSLRNLLIRRTASQVTEMATDYAAEDYLRGANRGHYYMAFCDVIDLPFRPRRAA